MSTCQNSLLVLRVEKTAVFSKTLVCLPTLKVGLAFLGFRLMLFLKLAQMRSYIFFLVQRQLTRRTHFMQAQIRLAVAFIIL